MKNFIMKDFICRFGVPKEIVSDNGSKFTTALSSSDKEPTSSKLKMDATSTTTRMWINLKLYHFYTFNFVCKFLGIK